MSRTEKSYTQPLVCGHCSHKSVMEVVANYCPEDCDEDDQHHPIPMGCGTAYELLDCQNCHKVVLRTYRWEEGVPTVKALEIVSGATILYPSALTRPRGVPNSVAKAYEAALTVRGVETNAYAVLLGRVLELVCEDRKAKGRTLNDKLADLAAREEIPGTLVHVAQNLKDLRNVGAHAGLGELSEKEVPILDALCRAILEYVYSAPHLALQAETRLLELKSKRKTRRSS